MGRRSISTTKSGKFMNPTDQARKEARKKELKKNKKQRQMVRAAVLKGKDPNQLIGEMEKIDRMEYDVTQPPVLNEKVLKDKRKKLKETFDRVLKLYEKEDPAQWLELKRLEADYEKRRGALVQYYESVKHAQQVQVDDIPLPAVQMPPLEFSMIPLPSDIPLPAPPSSQPQSILKKVSLFGLKSIFTKYKQTPGVPPGPPPSLTDDEDDDDDDEDEDDEMEELTLDNLMELNPKEAQRLFDKDLDELRVLVKQRKIRFADDGDEADGEKDTRLKFKVPRTPTALQAKMLAMAGQDINEFLKEMEIAHRHRDDTNPPNADESKIEIKDDPPKEMPVMTQPLSAIPGLPPGPPPNLPPGPPPGVPNLMFRPPPIRPGMPPLRLPPGPPPGRPAGPPGPPPGLPPRMTGPPLRLPPGPPPGIPPPRLLRPPNLLMPGLPPPPGITQSVAQPMSNPNVLSAPPSLINRPKSQEEEKKNLATIEAKPQIRNLSANIIRFMPTSLRVKRENKFKARDQKSLVTGTKSEEVLSMPKAVPAALPTKDDAYDQFMKEMEGLL